ncbi:MAG TPA: tripartite tricarboxylate transporter substrate binding protein [Deltaproteobacteria bacterium]|nr:tripartite tricarboxylate transporter substrate binding protein [Deltaproteobacteria bacterium]
MYFKKGFRTGLISLAMVLVFAGFACAETIEFVVPWSAGGGSDTMARFLVKSIRDNKLTDADFVVANKPGGNGQIGSAYVVNKKGRDNVWMTLSSGQISVPLAGLGKIKATDFTALAQIAGDVNLLVVSKDSPFKSVADVAKAAKANPGKLNVGGSATAAEDHICTYLLGKATGTKMNYTAFSGGGEVMSNLLGGHIDVAWANPNECIGQVKGGLARMLAVTTEDRLALLPDVPSFKELGYNMVFWQVRGVHGPPNMSKESIAWSVDLLKKATETDTWQKEYLTGKVLTSRFIPGADYTKVIKENEEMFREALGSMGLLKE